MNQPLKLGIYVLRFPVRSETFIVTKVLGLLERGFDVQIFAMSASADWDRFAILNGRDDVRARLHIAPPFRGMRLFTRGIPRLVAIAARQPGAFTRFVAHCWRHRRTNPLGFLRAVIMRAQFVGHDLDVLHVEFDSQGAAMVDLKEYFDCRLLMSARGTLARASALDRDADFPRRLYQPADGYHFISHFLRAEALTLGLDPLKPWWLIVPAIDLTLFAARPTAHVNTPDAPLRLLSVGRLDWAKGYEFALDAVARVVAAGIAVEYTILGDGAYREAILFAAAQHGLIESGVVRLAGAIGREAVPGFLHRADMLIHPALEEGFANAVIEAQAAGLPVVTSDAGGLPENVEDGVTGLVVPRRDADAMADAIVRLARDPALRQRMGEAGRARALAQFDLKDQIDRFSQLYGELTGSRGTHGHQDKPSP
ncbi:MAG: glycosyltransferase family 4 protein [Chloroflexota bacterium]|nr:glycosyltransferase family 4 protein [Chloroflexota bacterium]